MGYHKLRAETYKLFKMLPLFFSVLITQLTYVKPEGGVNVLEDIVIKVLLFFSQTYSSLGIFFYEESTKEVCYSGSTIRRRLVRGLEITLYIRYFSREGGYLKRFQFEGGGGMDHLKSIFVVTLVGLKL